MNRKATIFLYDSLAGTLAETDEGYAFSYALAYLTRPNAEPISLTLPLTSSTYQSRVLFPFFDGLIPEGWLLDMAQKNWKLASKDRFGLLLACCRDCIGAVSVYPDETL
jgi:serine/threonine-protein kinase HipA